MTEPFIPMGLDPVAADALHEGVPKWMAGRFYRWTSEATEALARANGTSRYDLVARFDEMRRLPNPLSSYVANSYVGPILNAYTTPEVALSYADYMVVFEDDTRPDLIEDLDDILASSGSAWRVGTRAGRPGLERRVSEAAQGAADKAMNESGTSGAILSAAWHTAFGISPDPSKAYSLAIKAVEEVAAPIITPKDPKSTLGKIVGVVRDQGWHFPLEEDSKNPSADVLEKMIRALWSGQTSRHGGNGSRPETQQEAETAVFLAVTLVQLFHSGHASR